MKHLHLILFILFPCYLHAQGEIGYHITTSGNLFKTTNSGDNWTYTFTSGVKWIDFVNDSVGYHVTTSGNLFKTVDSGDNWINTFTGGVGMVDFLTENIGYHITTNGNLFKTTDSGASWANTFTGSIQFIDFVSDTLGNVPVNVLETQGERDYLVYPNSTNGNFTIDSGQQNATISVSLMDLMGREIWSKDFDQEQFLDLEIKEPSGIYLFVIIADGKRMVLEVVKI